MRKENALYYVLLAVVFVVAGASLLAQRHAAAVSVRRPAVEWPKPPDARRALKDEKVEEYVPPLVQEARKHLGGEYRIDGRLTKANPGLDCMGLVFLAWSAVTKEDWRRLSARGASLLAEKRLGAAISGVDGVPASKLDLNRLEAGDIVFLLSRTKNPKEPPATEIDAAPLWFWHMGVYSGDGRWINADVYAGRVIEVGLAGYLRMHEDFFHAVWAVRPPRETVDPLGGQALRVARIKTVRDAKANRDASEARVRFEGRRSGAREAPVPETAPRWSELLAEKAIPETAARKIRVNKAKQSLTLLAGGQPVGVFLVGLGTNPVNDKLTADDRCTPEGVFRVASKLENTRWRKSVCLDYPTADSAAKREQAGKLGLAVAGPPGGAVCIHGSGPRPTTWRLGARRYVFNWTWGNIALDNEDIDQVYDFADVGQEVEIVWAPDAP